MKTIREDASQLWQEVEKLEKELSNCESAIREAEKKKAKEAAAQAAAAASLVLPELLAQAERGESVIRKVEGNAATLQQLAGSLKKALQAPALLVADDGMRLHLLAISPACCQDTLPANILLSKVAAQIGGKGGGKADMAQGSAPAGEDASLALAFAQTLIPDRG